MGRRRRQSPAEGLLDLLFELTGLIWQIGAVLSALLMFVSFIAFDWASGQYEKALSSPYLSQLAHSYGWGFYLLPLMIAGIALMLVLKTYESYRNGQF
jgi:TRAP-type C4-dicarboxylate transport system permease small subunit